MTARERERERARGMRAEGSGFRYQVSVSGIRTEEGVKVVRWVECSRELAPALRAKLSRSTTSLFSGVVAEIMAFALA